jgi:hypothetical protein
MSRSTFETASLTRLHWLGIVLALVTGAVHLAFGVLFLDPAAGVLSSANAQPLSFVLAGIAFFVAVLLLLLDFRRRLLYLVGIPFTGVQVVLYFALNWPDVLSPGGIGDKVVQVALIAVLVVLYRRES